MHQPAADRALRARIDAIRSAFPRQGLFAEKEWLLSPQPFPLSRRQFKELAELGPRLFALQKAFNHLYARSVKGSLPSWIAEYLDAGKPEALIAHGRSKALRDEVPRVIRPDLILTEDGFHLTELDNVPGGIGLTAWLNQTYAAFSDEPVAGGAGGMLEGFRGILPGGADIVVSEEASGYRPEMEWLAEQLNAAEAGPSPGDPPWQVHAAEQYQLRGKPVYRFFELFDLDNIPFARDWISTGAAPSLPAEGGSGLNGTFIPVMKGYLEEKLWLALFWLQPLRDVWRRELRDSNWRRLAKVIPYGWVMDPTPLPHHGVIPRLDINGMDELAGFSQKERDLVLKISGFSEKAWGSRGVHMGNDLPQEEWTRVVREALDGWKEHPYVLQEFHKAKRLEHPYWDPQSDTIRMLDARVRLCPYYFNRANPDGTQGDRVVLGGVLATICPADKKMLHGMRDAIMVPCAIAED